jgi:dTDP-4-amino-4,6-dideoxygalactose transaminase
MLQEPEPKLIRLSKSCLSSREKDAVMAVLDREFLGMGTDVHEFERELTGFFGRGNETVACVANGTAALHLALQACGIGPGDEVIVPSLTYVASFQAIRATGAIPVPCDVLPDTLTMDPDDCSRRITKRTRGLMPVHFTGGVGRLDAILGLAKQYGLRVIEDAAHAFGTRHAGRLVGGFGDIACFSFDGIKNITSGEGGCVVSADSGIIRQVQDSRLLGVEKDTDNRFRGLRSWEFDVHGQGWRYHMSNIMAAIGRVQLARFDELAGRRQELARRYDEKLVGIAGIERIVHDYGVVVPHIYVVLLPMGADREAIRSNLLQCGIQTGLHYQPNHTMSYFADFADPAGYPVVDAVWPRMLSLPLHPDLTDDDQDRVVEHFIDLINVK